MEHALCLVQQGAKCFTDINAGFDLRSGQAPWVSVINVAAQSGTADKFKFLVIGMPFKIYGHLVTHILVQTNGRRATQQYKQPGDHHQTVGFHVVHPVPFQSLSSQITASSIDRNALASRVTSYSSSKVDSILARPNPRSPSMTNPILLTGDSKAYCFIIDAK